MVYNEIKNSYYREIKKVYKENGFRGVSRYLLDYFEEGNFKSNSIALHRYLKDKIRYKRAMPHPLKIIEINPNKVEYMQKPRFKGSLFTYSLGGDWDKNKLGSYSEYKEIRNKNKENRFLVPIETYSKYKNFKKHFVEGIPWEETEYYQKRIKKIEERGPRPKKRTGTKEKLNKRIKGLDKLYKTMKEEGYKTQKEIQNKTKSEAVPLKQKKLIYYPPQKNEVRINIGRDGQLIFDEGRHRFIIARLLELDKIPVRVMVRHKKWMELRKEISKANNKNQLSEKAKKHQNHPDLQDLIKNLEK